VGILLLCLPAFSQLNSGSIAGGVTDSSGAVIPGAKVTITDVERGVTRTLVADEAGQYTAPSLTPGEYSVRAELAGFQTVEHTKIVVGVGQGVRIDLQLQTGGQAETVTVTEAAGLVDTRNELISNTVETFTLE
jgi:protocatechuate 3,4-dioxygenase beta subunit